jgi:hypothetical protein
MVIEALAAADTDVPVAVVVAVAFVAPIFGFVGTALGLRFNKTLEDRRRRDDETKRQMDEAAEQYRWARDQRRSTYNALLKSAYDLLMTALSASVLLRVRKLKREWADEQRSKIEELFKSLVQASTSVQLFGSPKAADLAIDIRQTGRQVTDFMDRRGDSAQERLSDLLDAFIAQCQTDLGIEALDSSISRRAVDVQAS